MYLKLKKTYLKKQKYFYDIFIKIKKERIKMFSLKEKIQALLLVLFFIGCLFVCSYVETTYTKEVIITNISNNIITAIDEQKNVWVFTKKNLCVGDKVKLIIDNQLTHDNIEDDIIKGIK